MRRNSPFFGAAVLLVDVGAVSSLFAVFQLVETGKLAFPALPVWLVCLLVCYVLLCLLLRKPRSIRPLLVVGGGLFLLQTTVSLAVYGRFAGGFGMIFSLGAWAATYYHAGMLALKPPTAEKIVTAFEMSVLTLLFSLFYCSAKAVSFACALPAMIASLCSLAALIGRRTATDGKATVNRGAGTVLGVLSAFALGALVLAGLAAGAVKSVVLALWAVVKAVVGFVGRCIRSVLAWLVSLIPEGEAAELPMEPPMAVSPDEMEGMEQLMGSMDWLMYALAGVFALAVLAVVVWLVIRGGGHFRRAVPMAGGRITRRRKPGAALSRWLRRVREAVRYHVCRILYRDTAPGLIVWLERRTGPGRKARKPTETCREFLLGLQPDYPGAESVLLTLAEDLDRHYFGGGSRLSKREIRAMRKTLRKSPGKLRK